MGSKGGKGGGGGSAPKINIPKGMEADINQLEALSSFESSGLNLPFNIGNYYMSLATGGEGPQYTSPADVQMQGVASHYLMPSTMAQTYGPGGIPTGGGGAGSAFGGGTAPQGTQVSGGGGEPLLESGPGGAGTMGLYVNNPNLPHPDFVPVQPGQDPKQVLQNYLGTYQGSTYSGGYQGGGGGGTTTAATGGGGGGAVGGQGVQPGGLPAQQVTASTPPNPVKDFKGFANWYSQNQGKTIYVNGQYQTIGKTINQHQLNLAIQAGKVSMSGPPGATQIGGTIFPGTTNPFLSEFQQMLGAEYGTTGQIGQIEAATAALGQNIGQEIGDLSQLAPSSMAAANQGLTGAQGRYQQTLA